MRKIIMMLMLAALLLTGCGDNGQSPSEPQSDPTKPSVQDMVPEQNTASGEETTPVRDAYSELQKKVVDSGRMLGVAYLGYYDTDVAGAIDSMKSEAFWNDFAFLEELVDTPQRCAMMEGCEWYAVIPAGDHVSLEALEYTFNWEAEFVPGVNPAPGWGLAYGGPLLLRCNISDIMPNILVRASDGSTTVEYDPCLSLENGRLSNYDGLVCDLTPYEQMDMFSGQQTGEMSDLSYIEVSREGVVDQIPVEIVSGDAFAYTIAMDPEYFGFTSGEGLDTFSYIDCPFDRPIYYCVYPIYGMSPQEVSDALVHQNGDNYAFCSTDNVTVGEYDALAVYLQNENSDPSYQMHFFVIECDGGSVVIETQFISEMYEGLYAIMRECFNTFTMLETE